MIKLSYCNYILRPLVSLNAKTPATERPGALLRVQYPDGLTGFADIHPWPELGDAPLSTHLEDLGRGRISPLIEQSMWLARRDALLRSDKRNIYDEGTPLKNNFTLTNINGVAPGFLKEIKDQGFASVKLKAGSDLTAEAAMVEQIAAQGLSVRLDFNGIGSLKTFERFIGKISDQARLNIEYVEDPFPYDEESWRKAQDYAPIALDNEFHKVQLQKNERPPFDVMVVKPARMDVDKAVAYCKTWNLRMTVTSSMDHPVGVAHAVGVAMELKKNHGDMILDAGCMTHRLYQMDLFTTELFTQGPYFSKGRGTGVGFDNILKVLTWNPLKTS